MKYGITRIEGSLRRGYSVRFDNHPPATVKLAEDYSGLVCTQCSNSSCDHIRMLRGAGYIPSRPELDELWFQRLPKLPGNFSYSVTTKGVWHGVIYEGHTFQDSQTTLYQNPRHFNIGRRRLIEVSLVRLDDLGTPQLVAPLYHVTDVFTPTEGGVIYQSVEVTPKVAASAIPRLVEMANLLGLIRLAAVGSTCPGS